MPRSMTLLLATIAFTGASTGSFGQVPASPDSALQAVFNQLEGTPLSLQQAIDYALKNSTPVLRAQALYQAAEGTFRREAGVFDPQLFFNVNYLDQKQPTASFFAGAPVLSTQQISSQTGLSMSLPIGTELQLSLNTVRLGTNSTFAFLNPEYDVSGSLTVRQPLLGGFAASARKRLTQSERGLEAEQARFDQQVLAASTQTENMYWDLYAAVRDYAVQKLTRDRAGAFLKETEVRARTGLVGPNQVASARTFLAEQELLLLEREEDLDRRSDQLASLAGVRPEIGSNRFLPRNEPPRDFALDSADALVDDALKSNLDLQAAQKDVEAAIALAEAAGWEALPNVTVVGSLGGAGLGGNPQTVVFGTDTLRIPSGGSFNDALRQTLRRDFPNWSVGLQVSVPIGFRSGLGEKERLDALVLNARQAYLEKSRGLEEQVRTACREVAHGASRMKAAREGVVAAQEQVRIGMIEFRNGRSTAFELVRLGEDFAVAQQRYSAALVRTAKAAATLKQLTSGRYQPVPHS